MEPKWLMVVLVVFVAAPSLTFAEMFTALVDLEKLLHTEGELIKTLHEYVASEEQRLIKIRGYLKDYDAMHLAASQDTEYFLSNPVNAYLLIKRLSSDWKTVQKTLTEDNGRAIIQNITEERSDLTFPDDEDLSGAAAALTRLQDTYQLDTSALARAGDCFELGRQSYNGGDHYHTVLWMQEALDRYDDEINKTIVKSEILEYLAFSSFMQGNVRHALKLTHELLEIVPNHSRAQGNIVYYEEAIAKTQQQKRGDDGDVPMESSFKEKNDGSGEDVSEREIYEKLCRRDKVLSTRLAKELKCRYVTNNNPYLYLQPVKEEEAFKKPRIVVYHDVMRDSEIEVIKELAIPRLKRATVQNYKSGELEFATYRISKSAWLKSEDDKVIEQVNKRIEDITGLDITTAEELQVVNYGIGGHYEPHFDFARREEKNAFKSLGTGNRIATFLFYMSDVPAGGATVFPHLGMSLWPRKGSAAFWYNLHKSGDGDLLTRHAACPVLAGSKWVSNKWFHERGQEFRRKCGLVLNE